MTPNVFSYATPTAPRRQPWWYRICWCVLVCAVAMLYLTIACGVVVLFLQGFYGD